jgi:hypothetical protein
MRKRINDSVQKWNHILKTAGTKNLVDKKRDSKHLGKFLVMILEKQWIHVEVMVESRFISTNG